MLSYMERGAYPPEYDEPEATKTEVMMVVFGREVQDGLGRDFDALMCDTSMQAWAERITTNPDAERDLFAFLGRWWPALPASVRGELEPLFEAAAKE